MLSPTAAASPPAPSATQIPGVVMSAAYAEGRRVADVRIEEAGEWTRRPGHLVWIGLYEPSAELLGQVQAQFGLHPLAIEDARVAHQRPKLERYGDGLFVVARTAQRVDGRIALGETHLFVGRGYVVTVRHGASVSYAPVREKRRHAPTYWRMARITSCMPCSTSSSTTTPRSWRPSCPRSRPSRTASSSAS